MKMLKPKLWATLLSSSRNDVDPVLLVAKRKTELAKKVALTRSIPPKRIQPSKAHQERTSVRTTTKEHKHYSMRSIGRTMAISSRVTIAMMTTRVLVWHSVMKTSMRHHTKIWTSTRDPVRCLWTPIKIWMTIKWLMTIELLTFNFTFISFTFWSFFLFIY